MQKYVVQRLNLGLTLLLLASLLLIAPASSQAQQEQPEQPKGGKSTEGAPVNPAAAVTINGNPLKLIINSNTSTDIRYRFGTTLKQQYYGSTTEGSANAEGAYLWYTGTTGVKVYGPQSVPAGNSVNAWTEVSNNVTGNGSATTPFQATTVVKSADNAVTLTQIVTYINGSNYATYRFVVAAPQGAPWNLFHAADLYTDGADSGYAFFNQNGNLVDIGGRSGNPGSSFYQFFRALSPPASRYEENGFRTIWNKIGSADSPGSGFANTYLSQTQNPVDNGAGLQWDGSGTQTIDDLVAFNAPAACNTSFTDVDTGNQFYSDILFLACANIVNGFPNGDGSFRFEPASNTTRGQFAKIAVLGFGVPAFTPTTPTFSDVPTNNTFYQYIEAAVRAGVISGFTPAQCGGGSAQPCFKPRDSIRRGEVAKIIRRARNYPVATPTAPSFSDVPTTNTFYADIETLKSLNVVGGGPCGSGGLCFRPSENIRRDELTRLARRAREITPTLQLR